MTHRADGTLVAGLMAALLVGVLGPAGAGAQERLPAGTVELGLGLGVSVSHNLPSTDPAPETVTGFHLLPRLGYVVTGEAGPGFLAGNFEVLLEPALIYLDAEHSSTIGGPVALLRWVFATGPTVRPYLEAGVGVLVGDTELRQTTCDLNYVIEGGPGVMIFVNDRTAVTAGYRYQHISNGDRCSKNLGLNSSFFTIGVSYFFP